jgi:hypothetical protein
VTINTATVQQTIVGNLGGQFLFNLAIPGAAVVPEPSTRALAGVSLITWRCGRKKHN